MNNDMQKPRVTVLLTSFNHAPFIRQAIDSVLNQTLSDWELIIWDDASSDNSWAIIQEYNDPRIRAYRNPRNLGPVYGINKAIGEFAQGAYVAMHHSDDVWLPNKLETQLALLENNPALGAVFSNALAIDELGMLRNQPGHIYQNVFDKENRAKHQWLRYFFEHGNALCHPSVLIRKECYKHCGYYVDHYGQLPDFDMWVRLLQRYDIHIVSEPLVHFRVRDQEANTSGDRPDARMQWHYEFYRVLHRYEDLPTEMLCQVFPEMTAWLDQGANARQAQSLAILEIATRPQQQLFALDLLATEPISCLERIAITKKQDVFGQEALLQSVNTINSLGIELKSLQTRERDLTQALKERDELAAGLDGLVKGLQAERTQIMGSLSWRVTAPLRKLCSYARKFKR